MKKNNQLAGNDKRSQFPTLEKKVTALYIDCTFFTYIQRANPGYRMADINPARRRALKNKVIRNSIRILSKVRDYSKHDILNITKCIKFIDKKFPHATLSFSSDYAIDIHELNDVEVEECLRQKNLKFKCIYGE